MAQQRTTKEMINSVDEMGKHYKDAVLLQSVIDQGIEQLAKDYYEHKLSNPVMISVKHFREAFEAGYKAAQQINQEGELKQQLDLIKEIKNIKSQAEEKKKNHPNSLSEAAIEADTCIDVCNHLLKFKSADSKGYQETATEIKLQQAIECVDYMKDVEKEYQKEIAKLQLGNINKAEKKRLKKCIIDAMVTAEYQDEQWRMSDTADLAVNNILGLKKQT